MNSTTRTISGFCTCKLCGQKIHGAPPSLEIGPNAQQREMIEVAAYINLLNEHLTKRHVEFSRGLQLEQAQFGGMRALQQFIVNDPALTAQTDKLRWTINQATRAASLTDKSIAGVSDQQAGQLTNDIERLYADHGAIVLDPTLQAGIKTLIRERMIQMLTETRDRLQEPDKYPTEPAKNLVIPTTTTH